MKVWLVLGILWLGGVSTAQNTTAVAKLMDEGKFAEAYSLAQKLSGVEGLVLAARSASYYAHYQAKDSEKARWYGRAEEVARKAIAADGENAEAYLELARAQGRLAQSRGIMESLGLAKSIKEDLEKTLRLNPKHAGARVALAMWHHSLTSRGVGWLYGARAEVVGPLFEEAIKLEPTTIIHKVEYAGVLAQQGRKAEAIQQLEVALAIPAITAVDRFDLERASKEMAVLK